MGRTKAYLGLLIGCFLPVTLLRAQAELGPESYSGGGVVLAQFSVDPLPTFGGAPIIRGPNSGKADEVEMRRRADQGDAIAQFTLGFWHETGDGVLQDYAEAMKWFRKSADNGYPRAQNSVGRAYLEGRGVRQSDSEAFKWFRLAAEGGFVDAQISLARMYQTGTGTPQDFVLAHVWLNLAGQRSPEARSSRDFLAREMLPAQIAEAQRLARECVGRKLKNC